MVFKRNNEQLIGDHVFIFLDPLQPQNPNNGVDDGSTPTFDEKVFFFQIMLLLLLLLLLLFIWH